MIDLHCHLLPGIDDGPADLDGTLAMARAHVDAGVGTVACTPHITWDTRNRAADIAAAVETVQRQLDDAGIPLRLVSGGELGLTLAVEEVDDEIAALHLGGGPWALIEPPISVPVPGLESMIGTIQARGHRVLIAHPERCASFHQRPELLERLVEQGAIAQATVGAVTGEFGRPVQRLVGRYVRDGLIHVMASDAHDVRRRPPGLAEPLHKAGQPDALIDWWCREVPRAILDGTDLPERPYVPEPRRRWWRRGR
ncbi:MAG: tyrosine-protein phosphatase [Solirubrobacteraceae bacterium]